jgi:adenosylcobyric acid synthase
MKALGILGTGSSVGKSWLTIAVCAWLHREGVRVAPFKAQNMSNNAWATADGREMARAQAIQADACGLRPIPEMNPVLLKPSGGNGSQVVRLGRAEDHCPAHAYFERTEQLWRTIADCLEYWQTHCDVLVLEGAGSPVELNLMERDLANLRPLRYLAAPWLLAGDIDRGGIFSQLAGTWALLPPADRASCLGAVINRFRGDLALFPHPERHLAPYAPGLRVLGTMPFRSDLQPEEEDGLAPCDEDRGRGETIAWVRLPHAANLSDCQPWWDDQGVRIRWTSDRAVLASAKVIVLPGTKNTLDDLRWLREQGLERALQEAAGRGVLVIGICGGFQLLGRRLVDLGGVAGNAGDEPGLGLLPVATHFVASKLVREVTAECDGDRWTAYEIHMGRTHVDDGAEPLQHVTLPDGSMHADGVRRGTVWGTYLHGWFESPKVRRLVAAAAGIEGYRACPEPWREKRRKTYTRMADLLTEHIDLDPVRRHLGL